MQEETGGWSYRPASESFPCIEWEIVDKAGRTVARVTCQSEDIVRVFARSQFLEKAARNVMVRFAELVVAGMAKDGEKADRALENVGDAICALGVAKR